MTCKCRQQQAEIWAEQKIVYGEQGLILIRCTMPEPESVVGYVTGYVYPFDIRPTMYVDQRDAVFLLGDDFVIEEDETS